MENKTSRQLNKVNEKLIEDGILLNGVIVVSNRNVPYLWLSHNNMNISVCYFKRTIVILKELSALRYGQVAEHQIIKK